MNTIQMASAMKEIIAGAKRTMRKLMGGRRRKASTKKAGRRHRRK